MTLVIHPEKQRPTYCAMGICDSSPDTPGDLPALLPVTQSRELTVVIHWSREGLGPKDSKTITALTQIDRSWKGELAMQTLRTIHATPRVHLTKLNFTCSVSFECPSVQLSRLNCHMRASPVTAARMSKFVIDGPNAADPLHCCSHRQGVVQPALL